MIEALSISQVETFDEEQPGGCPRRYWLERKHGLKPDQTKAQSDGEAGHALLATYLDTGAMPGKRVKMGKTVTAAILKGELPKPGADLIIEARFDGTHRPPHGAWVPMNVKETLWLAGVPFDGFIDLAYKRGPRPRIIDFKFSADIDAYARPVEKLIRTVQLPVYARSQRPYWPDAREWEIGHHYIRKTAGHSFPRVTTVSAEQIDERIVEIEAVVEQMKVVHEIEREPDVPFNRRACEIWMGCPHRETCSAYRRNLVSFTAEDLAVFNEIEEATAAAAGVTPATTPAAVGGTTTGMPPASGVTAPTTPAPRKRLQIEDRDPEIDEAKAAQLAADLDIPLQEARAKLIAKARKEAEAVAAKAKAEAEAELARVAAKKAADAAAEAKAVAAATAPDLTPPAGASDVKPPEPALCPTCSVQITEQNGSKLQSGLWVHVNCPKNAAAPTTGEKPADKPAPKARQPKPAAAPSAEPAAAPAQPSVASAVVHIHELGPQTRLLVLDLIKALTGK